MVIVLGSHLSKAPGLQAQALGISPILIVPACHALLLLFASHIRAMDHMQTDVLITYIHLRLGRGFDTISNDTYMYTQLHN